MRYCGTNLLFIKCMFSHELCCPNRWSYESINPWYVTWWLIYCPKWWVLAPLEFSAQRWKWIGQRKKGGLANEKKVFFPIDCKWLMELLGVDLEGLNTDMETYQENWARWKNQLKGNCVQGLFRGNQPPRKGRKNEE